MTRPVAPGERIGPRLTAQWYNSTLTSPSQKSKGGRIVFLEEGELYCLAKDGSATRYNPAGITGLADTGIDSQRIPEISSTENIDAFNWVIPQEDLTTDRMVLTVVHGLTKAWVTTIETDDPCVFYNSTTGKLETSKEGKANILVKGHTSYPSLICIGHQSAMVRAQAEVSSASIGGVGPYTVDTIKGINIALNLSNAQTLEVYNRHGWLWNSGALVSIEWVADNQEWNVYAADCPD